MNKVIRDGKVAVLVAYEFGTSWYSRHKLKALVFNPFVVETIENPELDRMQRAFAIEKYCDAVYGERQYWGDSTHLEIKWIPVGTQFNIEYNNGWEDIHEHPAGEFIA